MAGPGDPPTSPSGERPPAEAPPAVAEVTVDRAAAELAADALFVAGASAVHERDLDCDGAASEGGDGGGQTGGGQTDKVVLVADPPPSAPGSTGTLVDRLAGLGARLEWVVPAEVRPGATARPAGWGRAVATDRAVGRRLVVRSLEGPGHPGAEEVELAALVGEGAPPAEEVAPPAEGAGEPRVTVALDARTAFGGGSHPSTRVALAALEDVVPPGGSVLDVGCGTGVLAIAAVLLGAGGALALDTDPAAVRAATANVRANGLGGRVQVREGTLAPTPLPGGPAPDRLRDGPRVGSATDGSATDGRVADLVLANVLLPVLEELAAPLAAAVAPGGTLVVAGLLDAQRDRALAALAPLRCVNTVTEGDWVAMALRHDDPAAGRTADDTARAGRATPRNVPADAGPSGGGAGRSACDGRVNTDATPSHSTADGRTVSGRG